MVEPAQINLNLVCSRDEKFDFFVLMNPLGVKICRDYGMGIYFCLEAQDVEYIKNICNISTGLHYVGNAIGTK